MDRIRPVSTVAHNLVLIDQQPVFWFEDLLHTTISAIDGDVLMKWLSATIFNNAPLMSAVPEVLSSDDQPRIIFISVFNGHETHVIHATGKNIVVACKQAMSSLSALKEQNFVSKAFKVDYVTDVIPIHDAQLDQPLLHDRSLYGLGFSKEIGVGLLSEQLSANTFVNVKQIIRLNRIKRYFSSQPKLLSKLNALRLSVPTTLYRFTCKSLFTEGDAIYPLYRGHRTYYDIEKVDPLKHTKDAGDYLLRATEHSGQFVYSYLPKRDKVAKKYNILRHAGTIYAMLELYQVTMDEKLLSAAKKAIRFLIKQCKKVTINGVSAMCVVEKEYVKLGGNALAILAMAKYSEVTKDTEYLEYARLLAEWIRATQKSSGEFAIHKLHIVTHQVSHFVSDYYPGEAIFALARLYQIDTNPIWLTTAVNAARYIIDYRDKNVPEEKLNHDHWLLYGLNEVDLISPNQDFVNHGMKICRAIINAQHTTSDFDDWVGSYYTPPRTTPVAIRVEGLCAAYQMAKRNEDDDMMVKIKKCIDRGISFILGTQYQFESAMYLPKPEKALGGFKQSLSIFEIRIDYVQHCISALLGFEQVNKDDTAT